jgi:hypothetical protein
VALEIDQDRAISLPLAARPIVHAQRPHRAGTRKGRASDPSQQRVAASEQSQLLGELGTRSSSKGKPDEQKRSLETIGLAGVSGHLLQPLGEDRPLAPEVVAEKTADTNVKSYGYAMPGEVSDGAFVAAMHPPGVAAAHRTRCAGRGGAEVDAHSMTIRHQLLEF